ncbi:hypothetical protein TrLO_g4282 [Triparma laevis f. longispina]|uniref:PDZ domain-containing protein n=1 Tax=Triparma laevis f. longispina TaxID=1714387 RepID=A0A9W6ZPB8_9STRA|nr:hypothetical protein TrLO_g4282 [Triparma laevis f. longispina]
MFYEVLVLLLIHVASFNLSSWPAVRLRPSTFTRLHSVDPEYLLEQARTRSTFTRLYSVDPDDLLEQAARLREEADAIIREKTEVAAVAQEEERTTVQNNAAYKSQFSVVLPILKDTGKEVDEEVFFKPLFPQPEFKEISSSFGSEILRFDIPLPLGIILGQEPTSDLITIDEIDSSINPLSSSLLKPGDLLRCCSATQTQMSMPTWQLIVGGIGQPKTVRFMYSCDGFRSKFEEVLDALKSNRMDVGGRDVVLVVERK